MSVVLNDWQSNELPPNGLPPNELPPNELLSLPDMRQNGVNQSGFEEDLADRIVGADDVAVIVGVQSLEDLIEQLLLLRRYDPVEAEIHFLDSRCSTMLDVTEQPMTTADSDELRDWSPDELTSRAVRRTKVGEQREPTQKFDTSKSHQ